jgi:hypothetical protein
VVLSLTPGIVVVFLVVLAALVLFATEPVAIDITAIGIMVALMVLEPWTRVSPAEGVSGFASSARPSAWWGPSRGSSTTPPRSPS